MNLLDRRFLNISLTVLGIANSPAENPAAGDQYIVGPAGTGAFEGAAENSIARYNGSTWTFSAPRAGTIEALDVVAGTIIRFDGTSWVTVADFNSFIAPVLGIVPTGDELPATCAEGAIFLNTSDNKLYTATAEDTWNDGVALTSGARYASSSDFKIYQSDGTELHGSEVHDGGMFLNKADGCIYVYDAATPAFRRNSAVEFTADFHTLTAEEATAKSFTLTHNVAAGHETNMLCFVSGVAQVAGTDFAVSGNTLSWDNKGLASIDLAAGDPFIVFYVKA